MNPRRLLTLADCIRTTPLSMSALSMINKIAFKPSLGHTVVAGKNYWSSGSNICHLVRRLERLITQNKFEFGPCSRRDRIIKGRERIIYISTWEDRIVERWLNDSMNRLLDSWFCKSSYAYRTSELGLDECQNQIAKHIRQNPHVTKRDISKYFYSIDHDIMLDKVKALVAENDPLYRMIEQRVRFKYFMEGSTEVKDAPLGNLAT